MEVQSVLDHCKEGERARTELLEHYRDLNSAHEFSIPDHCCTRPDLIYTHESRHYVSQSVEYARIISLINFLTRLRVCNIRGRCFAPIATKEIFRFPSFLPSFLSSGIASFASFVLREITTGSLERGSISNQFHQLRSFGDARARFYKINRKLLQFFCSLF